MTTTLEEVGAGVRDEPLTIADRTFRSRLIVGSGKYESFDIQLEATRTSAAEMITVALRRVPQGVPKSARSRYAERALVEGDRVEILEAVGGG